MVQASWHGLGARRAELPALFYGRLFELDPGARHLVAALRQTDGDRLLELMERIVPALERPETLVPELVLLARRYLSHGLREPCWERVGDAMLWSVEQLMHAEWNAELRLAWSDAVTLIISVMRRATGRMSGSIPASPD